MSLRWEPASVKAQLRSTSQKLGQLQEKKDSQSLITRKDVATLLQQKSVWLARAKVQSLLLEDASADLLERLEMYLGVLLERFTELDLKSSLSSVVLEAAASIIHAAPYVESTDLQIIRNLLAHHLGPDFTASAASNHNNCVPPLIVHASAAPPPTAQVIDAYLQRIARSSGVDWEPELTRHNIVNALTEVLDTASSSLIELSTLRELCSHGIPDEPAWLRPRIWKLFFGILPVRKAAWRTELRKQRNDYYDLVRRLLEPFSKLGEPSTPLSHLDASLLNISQQLSRIPASFFEYLEEVPAMSCPCPLNVDAPDDIRISCAVNLETRLEVLGRGRSSPESVATPEIRLEVHNSESSSPDNLSKTGSGIQELPTTLLSSKAHNRPPAHPKHFSALLRILYLHATINPGILSPHVPSLLVPLYTILAQEVEPEDIAHVEADTFWLFEAMMGEFCEFEDEETGNTWLCKFGQNVAWADRDLYDTLCTNGLDPALPHYSFRWLATLLTHTLPTSSIIPLWDVLFSYPMRSRGTNYKMNCLLDICTGMLHCTRMTLMRLCKSDRDSRGLWTEQDNLPKMTQYSSELTDGFMESMSFLQRYPVQAAGGIERILQAAYDLSQRRQCGNGNATGEKLGFGARIKVTMWNGLTNHLAPRQSPLPLYQDSVSQDFPQDDGSETETQLDNDPPALTSRLATTVWKGITNQTAMESPPSPLPSTPLTSRPSSPLRASAEDSAISGSMWPTYSSLWGYAEKLRDSDAAATLAKVSSNWKAKALMTSWGRTAQYEESNEELLSLKQIRGSPIVESRQILNQSLPITEPTYSPPPCPMYFRPPRDSFLPSDTEKLSLSALGVSPPQPPSDPRPTNKISNLQVSLAAFTGSSTSIQPVAKSGPRPLLLSSASLITPTAQRHSVSRTSISPPIPLMYERKEASEMRGFTTHRDSLSSISSLSPSDALSRPQVASKSDRDSDISASSRRIPLNRKSISPLAPHFRSHHSRLSRGSSVTSSEAGGFNATEAAQDFVEPHTSHDTRGVAIDDLGRSPVLTSPPIPHTPISNDTQYERMIRITESERHRGSVLLENQTERMLVTTAHLKKPFHKKTPPVRHLPGDTSDSSVVRLPSRSPRVRSKRYQPMNPDVQTELQRLEVDLPTPNTLSVEWLSDDQDLSPTPRTSEFNIHSQPTPLKSTKHPHKTFIERKLSNDGRETRIRKVSANQRSRKVSSENKEVARKARESAAEEGDDEGCDGLLSTYESEEGVRLF
ncbi:hypothetical protein AX17_003531 [Amanita inopinata Kibby_2008]|nr:hypothetical protein AX17_003531 [Amanita inopinata Kibby_2008]